MLMVSSSVPTLPYWSTFFRRCIRSFHEMRQLIEVRMGNDTAQRVLGDDVGTRIGYNGFIRKVVLEPTDPLAGVLAAAQAEARRHGTSTFTYTTTHRTY